MKILNPNENKDARDRALEEVLLSLPQNELPSHIEHRVLYRIQNQDSKKQRLLPWVSHSLQWASLAVGVFFCMTLGALMTKSITAPEKQVFESMHQLADPIDPSLLDFVEILGG